MSIHLCAYCQQSLANTYDVSGEQKITMAFGTVNFYCDTQSLLDWRASYMEYIVFKYKRDIK